MVERKSTTALGGKSKINLNLELDDTDEVPPAPSQLRDVTVLSLADEDPGGDPYNNTGQHFSLPESDEE